MRVFKACRWYSDDISKTSREEKEQDDNVDMSPFPGVD
jgi:hypothetical protein